MGLEMGGEGVEGLLHQGVVGDAGRLPPAQPAEEGAAEAVGGEEPVQIAAHDPAVARACTVRPACKGDQRPRRVRPRGAPPCASRSPRPPRHLRARGPMHERGACPRSSPFRHRAGRAPVSPPAAPRCRPGRRRGGPASGSPRRGPPASRRAARARLNVECPAFPVQRLQVAAGRLAARQQHEVGVPRQRPARRHEVEHGIGLGAEGVEIVGVRDARQAGHSDFDRAAGRGLRASPAWNPGSRCPRRAAAGPLRTRARGRARPTRSPAL